LKAGEYPAQIIQVQVKFSKCGNYEQHALRVRVEDAANDHWEDFWERLTFSDTAMWKVEQAMSAVGLDAGVERDILPEEWVERRGRVQLTEKDGKLEIKRWLPAKAAAVKAPLVRKFPDALNRLSQVSALVAGDGLPF
jgi:hypothetical protein